MSLVMIRAMCKFSLNPSFPRREVTYFTIRNYPLSHTRLNHGILSHTIFRGETNAYEGLSFSIRPVEY